MYATICNVNLWNTPNASIGMCRNSWTWTNNCSTHNGIRQSLHSIRPNQCLNALEQVVAESKSFPLKNWKENEEPL